MSVSDDDRDIVQRQQIALLRAHCDHRRVAVFDRGRSIPETGKLMEYRTCGRCHEWLPLGPSNDSDPRVQLEMRAAELADAYNADAGRWDGFVSLGMCSPQAEHAPLIETDIIAGRKWQRDLDDYYAGHLAAEIATHDTRRSTEGEE